MRTRHDAVLLLGKFIRIEFNVAVAMLALASNVTRGRLFAWLTHSDFATGILIFNPLSPMFVVARGVQNCGHHDRMFRFQNFVNDAVGKSFRVTPADVLARMTAGIEQRIFRDRIPNLDDFLHKFHTKPGLL
jgi:hypothetical protein